MKRILTALAAVLLSSNLQGQGQVVFENFTINAPIFGPDGRGLGPEARAQIFWNGVGFGRPQPFEPSAPGFFFAGIVDLPGVVPVNTYHVLIIRAWVGDSFETAEIRGEIASEPAFVLSPAGAPPSTVPFESFTIPEPTAMAIALIGAAVLVVRQGLGASNKSEQGPEIFGPQASHHQAISWGTGRVEPAFGAGDDSPNECTTRQT